MNDLHLKIRSLSFQAGSFRLRRIDFVCRRGEYHVLLGPSGSGKTTLLKCILGLYRPQSGEIELGGRDLHRLPIEKRRLGYLPQSYGLFPHLTVDENIRFGLGCRSLTAPEKERLVKDQYAALKIEALKDRDVRTLSGGEQQKVALSRALIAGPEVVLLDEPFSAIDEGRRRRLWFELKEAIRSAGVTAVHITHNLEEAYTLADRISVLIGGEVVQSGEKEEIFRRPAVESVARFLGYRNIFSGPVRPFPGGAEIEIGHFQVTVGMTIPTAARATVCVRPQDIKIVKEGVPLRESLRRNVFPGRIVSLFFLPEYCLARFRIDSSPREYDFELKFPIYIKDRLNLGEGKPVRAAFWEPSIIVFSPPRSESRRWAEDRRSSAPGPQRAAGLARPRPVRRLMSDLPTIGESRIFI